MRLLNCSFFQLSPLADIFLAPLFVYYHHMMNYKQEFFHLRPRLFCPKSESRAKAKAEQKIERGSKTRS